MPKVLFPMTLIVLFVVTSVWAADISGTWTVTMKNAQNRDESFDLLIKENGENLTVTTANHPALKNLVGTGTLKGDAVAMSIKTTDEHNIEFVFAGKVSGNKITGNRELKLGAPPAGRTIPTDGKSVSLDEIPKAFTAEKK